MSRLTTIQGILSNIEFEVCEDYAAFIYKDKEIYLNCTQWFDGTDTLCIDFLENGEPAELTQEEQDEIFKTLCKQYDTYQNFKEQEEREAAYEAMTTQETYDHINRNFHIQY